MENNNTKKIVVLASESPRRHSILKKMRVDFEVCIPENVKEIGKEYYYPDHVPVINAIAKAESVAGLYPARFVIGADTVVLFKGNIIEKPVDIEDAKYILSKLSGNTHTVITSVAILNTAWDFRCIFSDTSEVTFFPLTDEVISEYIKKVNVLDKAGAYAVQEYGSTIIREIKGSVYNVMGLPKEKLEEALKVHEIRI